MSDATMQQVMSNDPDTNISVGSGSPTFDDFDSMTTARQNLEEEVTGVKPKETTPILESTGEPIKPPTSQKSALTPEEKAAENIEKDKEIEATSGPQADKAEVKMLKALNGDAPMDIPHDLQIPTKVDGQMQNVSLEELQRDYNGRTVWDKKFSELDVHRREIKEKEYVISQHQAKLDKFKELAKSDNPLDSMNYLLDLTDQDSYTYMKSLRDKLIPDMEAYAAMTDEERRAHDLSLENESLKKRQETLAETREYEQTQAELLKRINTVRASQDISEDDFRLAYEELAKEGVENIDPELVGRYISEKQAVHLAESVLTTVNPDLVKDQATYDEMIRVVKANPELKKEDLVEIATEVYGDKDTKIINEKIGTKPTGQQKPVGTNEEAGAMFSDWED